MDPSGRVQGRRLAQNENRPLRQIGADQVAALEQVRGIPLRTIAPESHLLYITPPAVLSQKLGDDITTLARASRALDAQRVQLASNIAKREIGPGTWLFTAPAAWCTPVCRRAVGSCN
jgi:hypothetical protein